MDSFTQIVLGSSVGYSYLGKKEGRKAALWGGIGGLIPDLDVIANIWLSPIHDLTYHRTLTHSILFVVLASPLFGWLVSRKSKSSLKEWTMLFFLAFFTHVVLDCLTSYGTAIFWPLSDYRVAFNSIFIIDPLYTIPFVILLITALIKNSVRINNIALAISTSYLVLGLIFKGIVIFTLQDELNKFDRYTTMNQPLSIIFWRIMGEDEEGYYNGTYTLFSREKPEFEFVEKNHELLKPYINQEIEDFIEFSKGYYLVRKEDDSVIISDYRFSRGGESLGFATFKISDNGIINYEN